MPFEVHKFQAGVLLNKKLLWRFNFYSNALKAVLGLTIDKYTVYGIYDTIKNKYIRFRIL